MKRTKLVVAVAAVLAAAALRSATVGADAYTDELERANRAAAQIEREWPLGGAGPLASYIRTVGQRLGGASGPSRFGWSFLVVRDLSANAFSIGAGRIYVNEGTLVACRNEAEFAAILAHEMGHELAGHFRRPESHRSAWSQWSRSFGIASRSASEVRIGSVVETIDPADEMEADRVSLGILRKAGYDPHAALAIAERLNGQQGGGAHHFSDGRRIASLRSALSAIPSGGRKDSEEFQRVRERLVPH